MKMQTLKKLLMFILKAVEILLVGRFHFFKRLLSFLTLLNIIFFTLLVLITGAKYPLLTVFFKVWWALIIFPLLVAALLMVVCYIKYHKDKQKIGGDTEFKDPLLEVENPFNFITFLSLFLRLFFSAITGFLIAIALHMFIIFIVLILTNFPWR